MSMQLERNPNDFQFDRADRIRRAMRVSGLGTGDLADALEVSRNTVTNWISGRTAPRPRDLKAIALRTGFPFAWLETGEAPHDGGTPGKLPGLDSNQEPIG
ncbi:helix-turn-helix domain-containing protein [Microbacterium sp. cx-55]|uniref:helix-turn-helix domain-containing protein n=1 Tax=Microbacterium sp. cx-55 TaxID=2875948 RepID=UPI001DFA0F6D|nr:helix-turn-helix domain-containing protein [Microbacterium sp. cx-55]